MDEPAAALTDTERAVIDAVHDTMCACRTGEQNSAVFPVGPRGKPFAAAIIERLERSGYQVSKKPPR